MATISPRLSVPYIVEGQDDKETAHSEGVNRFESIIQLSVLDRDIVNPDNLGSPTADVITNGDVYLVPSGGAGDFVGKDDDIAAYYDGWLFFTPRKGWLCYVEDENLMLLFDGAAWVNFAGAATAGLVETRSGHIEAPLTKTYVLEQSAAYLYDIDTLIGQCSNGDVVVTMFIGAMNVEGISAVSFTDSESTATATGGSPEDNTVHVGDRVTMVITAGSPDPLDFSFTLKTTRL